MDKTTKNYIALLLLKPSKFSKKKRKTTTFSNLINTFAFITVCNFQLEIHKVHESVDGVHSFDVAKPRKKKKRNNRFKQRNSLINPDNMCM